MKQTYFNYRGMDNNDQPAIIAAPIKGYAVQEGFYTLIVSRDISYPGCRYWQVTEARSGILVARDFETRRAALEALPHLIRQYGGKIAANRYYQEGNINESLYPIYKTLRAKNN